MLLKLSYREILILWRTRSAALQRLASPLLLLLLISFTLPAGGLNAQLIPAMIVIVFMLGILPLGTDALAADWQTGWLDQAALVPHGLLAVVYAKLSTLILCFAVPLALVLFMAANIISAAAADLLCALLLAAPSAISILLLGNALTLSQANAGLVLLLVLPLLVPVLILLGLAAGGMVAALWWLAALAVLALGLLPLAIAAALRLQLST